MLRHKVEQPADVVSLAQELHARLPPSPEGAVLQHDGGPLACGSVGVRSGASTNTRTRTSISTSLVFVLILMSACISMPGSMYV